MATEVNNEERKPERKTEQIATSMNRQMQRYRSVFDKEERNLLLYGYIREEIQSFVPSDVINICVLFYDDVLYWILEDDELRRFRKLRSNQTLWNNEFDVEGITFQNGLKTSGKLERQNGFVQYLLSSKHIPNEVEKVWVYVVLYCEETKYETRTTKIFQTNGDQQTWAAKNMKLSNYNHYNSLTFGCQVDVLHIKYKYDEFDKKSWSLPIKIYEKSRYDWYIEGNRLKQFKNATFGQHFYSPNFNKECFCLASSPKGWTIKNQNKFIFQLKLIKLPWKISKILIKLKIQCCFLTKEDEWGNIDEDAKKKYIQWFPSPLTFSYKQCRSGWTEKYKIDSKQIIPRNSVWCKAKIDILEVYDKLHYKVDKNKWEEYGVIMMQDEVQSNARM